MRRVNGHETGGQVHILSFEGPDAYSRAGGIASRVTGLANALADAGCDTHLWYIGDARRPGHERLGRLTLHRWCQWISACHPGGVYDGEEGKHADYASSLPPFLLRETLLPHLERPRGRVAILAEEWQTVHAVLHLDWLLRRAGVRDRVALQWNANNTFGFERIDWPRLAEAATITTVSRYMRHEMSRLGVDALVIPNGLPADAFRRPNRGSVREFRQRLAGRLVLSKVARWDPDKRWLLAVETIARLKQDGAQPLLVARGGMEAHGREVLERAAALGLRIGERVVPEAGAPGLLASISDPDACDIMVLGAPLDREACQLLFEASAAVLANSGREPFGLVGLEAMAAGGVACVGATGEDYAVAGWNALVLQTQDPREFVREFGRLRARRGADTALRRHALATAPRYAWPEVVAHVLHPRLTAESNGGTDLRRPGRSVA